jgi:large subunit ribosomal protein L13
MRTYMPKKGEIEQRWHLVDGEDQVVGRLASRLARVLMGKHRPEYTPHMDTGDYVVVVNAAKVRFTGRKAADKRYFHYTGYPGGLRERTVADLLERKPTDVLFLAVRRMLPKTRLGRQMIQKLKIYPGADHPHDAQQPQPLTLK